VVDTVVVVRDQRRDKTKRVKQQKRVSRPWQGWGRVAAAAENVSVSYLCNCFVSVFVLKYNSELRNLQIIPKNIPPFISQPGDVSDRPAPRVFNVLAKFGIFPSGKPVVFPNFYVFKSSCRKEKKIRRQH